VVETRPNAESIAETSLLRLGYEPLVVRYNKLLKGVRIATDGRRLRSRGDELVLRPFIPGYLFLPLAYGDDAMLVDADHGWGKPQGIKRVLRGSVGADGRARPKLIRASIVEQIRAAALAKDETPKQVRQDLRERMDAGLPVRVRHPLGFTATLVSLDDRGRARYFAECFGGEIAGTFSNTEELELVDA
jgi:hypothetical protein